jgi:hypothetical protein
LASTVEHGCHRADTSLRSPAGTPGPPRRRVDGHRGQGSPSDFMTQPRRHRAVSASTRW